MPSQEPGLFGSEMMLHLIPEMVSFLLSFNAKIVIIKIYSYLRNYILKLQIFRNKANFKFYSDYFHFVHGFNGQTLILGNIEESEEDGTLPNRKTTFSKIRIRPNSADNQVTYACEASHPALRGTPTRPASPMRSSVLLSVLCRLFYIIYTLQE